jgi:hypothetical protein
MKTKALIFSTVIVFGVVGTGCVVNQKETAEGAPLVRQITASDQCGVVAPGLIYLNEQEDLERLQGLPMQNLSMKQLNELNFDREHVLVVGLGQKPTGGYGLTLANSRIIGDTLKITVILRRPPADAMVTQVLTTPCAVMAVTPRHWDTIEVAGNGLDTLTLSR